MTDTNRLGRQSLDRITGADLLATWSERLGGNVGMSLNEFLKWLQENSPEFKEAAVAAAAAAASASASAQAAEAAEDGAEAARDEAEAAAAGLTGMVTTTMQTTGGGWPPRPPFDVVHWYGWDFPTNLMGAQDEFHHRTQPVAPAAPDTASWAVHNRHNGTQFVLQILSYPDLSPAITAIEYNVDGGAWVSVPVANGDTVIAAASGNRNVQLRYTNFVGVGTASAAKTVNVNAVPFTDAFTRADQPLADSADWTNTITPSGHQLVIVSNEVRASTANQYVQARCDQYLPPDQYAQCTVVAGGANTNAIRGVRLICRMQSDPTLCYELRVRNAAYTVMAGPTEIVTALHGQTLPAIARLELQGTTVRAYLGGVLLGTWVNSAYASGFTGLGNNAASSDGTGGVKCDNFEAGAL